MNLKPFFGYFGGKYRIATKYPEPTHEIIIEPFAGAAGYSLRYSEKDVILVEKSHDVAGIWRYLISASSEEILGIPLLESSEQKVSDITDLTHEQRMLIGFNINAGAAVPRDRLSNFARDYRPPWPHMSYRDPETGWQRPCKEGEQGTYHPGYENFWGEKRRARIARQVEYIKHWKIIEGDYTEAPDISATWFIDPPYEKAGKSYPCRDIDRVNLAEWCTDRFGQVMVCEAEGANWLPFERLGSFKSTPGKKRPGKTVEVLYYQES